MEEGVDFCYMDQDQAIDLIEQLLRENGDMESILEVFQEVVNDQATVEGDRLKVPFI